MRDRVASLFALAVDRDACVFDYLEHSPTLVVWAPVFVRPAFPEDDSINQFFAMLDMTFMRASSPDRVRWSLTSVGKFTVKSYFVRLSSPFGITSSVFSDCGFPWNISWKSRAL